MEILLLYYIFSVLFMIGYVNTEGETIYSKLFIYFIVLIIAPIMFPISIGYMFKKLINYGNN